MSTSISSGRVFLKNSIVLSMLLMGVVLSSCGNHTSNKETTAEDVKKEIQESIDVTKDFVSEEYDELLNSLE